MTRRILIPGIAIAAAIGLGAAAWLRADWSYSPESDKWSHTDAHDDEGTASDNQFQLALKAYQGGDLDSAERILKGWIRYYRDKRDGQAAMFLLGEVQRTKGDYDAAFESYEDLLDHYGGTDLFDRVLGNETEMAKGYLDGRKHQVLKMFWVSATDEGQKMLERVFQRDPHGVRGKKAMLTLADYHFRIGHSHEARDEYERLVKNFPHDDDVPQWNLLKSQADMAGWKGIPYEVRPLGDAEHDFKALQDESPDIAKENHVTQIRDAIQERQAEKDFDIAEFYNKLKKTKAAIFYYRALAKKYPGTIWAQRSRDRLAALGVVDDKGDSQTPPSIAAAGVGLPRPADSPVAVAPQVATGDRGGPGQQVLSAPPGSPSTPPIVPANPQREDIPPVIAWCGPVPTLRNFEEGIIDIGCLDKLPGGLSEGTAVSQIAEVADPAALAAPAGPPARPNRPATQPEGGHGR